MSNSKEIMESGNNTKSIVIIEDDNQLKDAIFALLTGDFIVGDPVIQYIQCKDMPCEPGCHLAVEKLFTPPHKKNRRGKFKRSGK